MKFLVCIALLVLTIDGVMPLGIRPTQSIEVRGKFICKGKPASGVKVKIYDQDTFTLDDLMGETKSDGSGSFRVVGKSNEVTRLTPKMNIYHKCGKLIPLCYTKFSVGIPKSYLSSGKNPTKVYDAGTFNLDGKMPGQGTDCLN